MKEKTNSYIWLLILVLVALFGTGKAAEGKIIYVDADAIGAENGSSWEDAYNDLQDAWGDAGYGDEIRVAEGVYRPDEDATHPDGSGNRNTSFWLRNGVAVKGGYAGYGEPDPDARDIELHETILSGDLNGDDGPDFANNGENSYHVVIGSGTNSTAVLDGFTIIAGNANGTDSESQGGGMLNISGSPTVNNCVFTENSADSGGGIRTLNSSITLTNCTFNNNSALLGGGIFTHLGSPILVDCTFSGNTSVDAGGGIHNVENDPTLTNCTFIDNSAEVGGGMFNNESNPTVTNCTFSDNWAEVGGGMTNWESSPTLTNCMFNNNLAGGGGGMSNAGNSSPTLTNCAFIGNSAAGGGGMWNDYNSNPTLTDCTFSGNSSEEDGGGMFNYDSSNPRLTNCMFSNNSAAWGGGMCIMDSSNPTLTSCTFNGNSAAGGGGMFNNESNPTVTNCTFSDNWAEVGGGMSNGDGCSPTLTNCTFSGNWADWEGGGMCNNESNPTLNNCTFTGNSAGDSGGCMTNWESSPTLTNCIFKFNEASWSGGGMCNAENSSPTLTNCTFSENSGGDGGGMFNVNSNPTLTNCIFTGNSAYDGGGMATYESSESSPIVTNCTFSNNTAVHGGGMLNELSNNPSVTNCTFNGNSADFGGGMNNYESSPSVTNCTFNGNSADLGGGGMRNELSNPSVTNCILWDNTARSGAQIYNDGGSLTTVSYSDVQGGWPGTGNINADPMFVEPDSNDYHLQPDSPCIDAGDNTAVPAGVTTDLDGNPRIRGPAVDMGVYERPFVLFVDIDAAGANDGSSWENAFNHLQDAITFASINPAEIRVAEGTYTPAPPGGDREATFQLVSGVAVKGGYAGYGEPDPDARDIELHETILSGDLNGDDGPDFANNGENSYHVVTGSGTDETVVVDGFTITAGNANGGERYDRGGGMFNEVGNLTLSNCTFTGNSAHLGGGMHNKDCSSTITGCTFSGNLADVVGGGMFNLYSSDLTIANCTFSGNSAGWSGGGMFNDSSNPRVTNCTFSDNSAESGGGISNNENCSPKLINCTFSGNSAENGGGISNNEDSSPTVTNCILWDNTAPSGAQIYNDEMSSTTVSYSCVQGYVEPSESEIQGLISRWQFDEGEGSTAYDSASNNHGIIYGEAEWTTGIIGGALDFDGYNDYVSLPIGSAISSLTNSTIATWVNWSGGGTWQRCWDFGSSTRVNMFLTTQNSYTGTPRFAITTTGNQDEDQTTAPDALSDGWHHLAVTINADNSTHSLYIDGELVDENTSARYTPSHLGSTTQNWLGRSQYSADPYLEGRLDDVRIYERALSDEEIEQLYQHGFGGQGNIDADPMFVEPDSNDYHLQPDSPCIDAGDNTAVPAGVTTDLDGNPRISGPAVDMGAYERPFVLFVDVDAAGANDGSSWENAFNHLQDAIAFASINPAEIRVAEGIYTPAPPGGDREATFQLVSGVAVKGGYAGYGEPDPDARDIELYETILSGDLNGDDGPDFANDGENSFHVVTGSNCDQMAILDGLTITAGNAFESRGGGMFNESGSPTLTNCTFSGNSASPLWGERGDEPMFGEGGGMFSEGGSPMLTDCTFSGNVAYYGGGMHNENSDPTLTNCTFSENEAGEFGGGMCNNNSNPIVTNCTFSVNERCGMYNKFSNPIVANCSFSGNSGPDGAGMYNEESNPVVTNCTFSGNSAGGGGGGMSNNSSNPIVTNCNFSVNSASYGGGILYGGEMDGGPSDLTITNCTFNGNWAEWGGGGMFLEGDDLTMTMTMTNCTFNGNSADDRGGGIYTGTGELTITNCIFWGNTAPTEPQIDYEPLWSPASPMTVTYSDVQGGWPGEGNIDADPSFVDADGVDNIVGTEDDNLSLLAGSACADAGNNYAVPPDVIFDLYGDPRFADDPYAPDTGHGTAPIVDMGAYEGAKPSFLSTESVAVPEGQTATFTVALTIQPAGTVQVNVAYQSGDPDITIQSGAVLTFDPTNYSIPQTVVLTAAEDEDHLRASAKIRISAPGFINCAVTATELDNEPNPDVLFVDASATGGNNGMNWPNALTDLQEALHLAAEYPQFELVLVAEGVYTPAPPEGDRGATFQLVSGVAMYGGFPTGGGSWQDRDPDAYRTILSGDLNGDDGPDFANNGENSSTVVTSEGAIETTVLDGFTVTGGSFIGMRNFRSSPTITNCIFSGNKGFCGMENVRSSPTITNCIFSGNSGYYGGMTNQIDSSPTITNCTFSGNSAEHRGGGIDNWESSPTITNCTFSGNSSDASGGGMYNIGEASPTITNCTFTGNSAGASGGGMYNTAWSSATVTNCTFSGNSALNGNDCACDSPRYPWPSIIEITNCILWSGGQEIWNNDGSTITISYTDLQNGQAACFDPCNAIVWSMGNIDDDPLFIDASSGDLHLLPSSPCVDAGDPLSYFGLEPEPDGGRINMGAYGNTPEATCKGGLVLKSYNMVSKVRSSRTTFNYEFTVTLNNNSTADVHNVQLEMLDTSGNVVMLDSEVNFAYIAAGETATSEDTFSLSVDRAIPIDATTISWRARLSQTEAVEE